jgi:hypothetical protein
LMSVSQTTCRHGLARQDHFSQHLGDGLPDDDAG